MRIRRAVIVAALAITSAAGAAAGFPYHGTPPAHQVAGSAGFPYHG